LDLGEPNSKGSEGRDGKGREGMEGEGKRRDGTGGRGLPPL